MSEELNGIEKLFIDSYDNFYDKIYNYIFRSIPNKEISEDLASNTFYKALRYLKKNSKKIVNIKSWLYKIATNEILMHLRYNKDKIIINFENEDFQKYLMSNENVLSIGSKEIDFIAVRQAIDKLKSLEKVIIEMHYFESMDYREISEVLNIKENTLRSLMHRTIKKLYDYFKG